MADAISIEVSLKNFDTALQEYARVTRKDAVEVVRQQSRLVVQDLVKRTASTRGGVAVRKTIENDIRKVFKTPSSARDQIEALIQERTTSFISKGYEAVHNVKWRNAKLGKRIEQLFDKQDAAGMESLWRRVYGDPLQKMPITDQIESSRLRAARNPKTGSVPKGARGKAVIYAGRPANLNKFIRERQADINLAKAGWVAAANALDAKIPASVRKQTKRFGRVELNLTETALAPFVLIVNSATPAIAQDASYGIVAKALEGRARAINFNIQRTLERAAKKFNKS